MISLADTLIDIDPYIEGSPLNSFTGWSSSPWYLNFNVDFWPWIYHDEHGWQFVAENSTSEVIFVWDPGLNAWLLFSENTFRWLFLFDDNSSWIWSFSDNTLERRFFQRLDDGSIFSVPAGL